MCACYKTQQNILGPVKGQGIWRPQNGEDFVDFSGLLRKHELYVEIIYMPRQKVFCLFIAKSK